jgi:mutator family transposase
MDLASTSPPGSPNCAARHNASDILTDTSPPSVLSSPTVPDHARRSAGRHGQRPDPPEHRPEQLPGRVTLCQQHPVLAGVRDQPAAGLDEALLQRPAIDAPWQHQSPPQIAQIVGEHAQLQPDLVRPEAVARQARPVRRLLTFLDPLQVLGATWQRCKVHFLRNALAHAGKGQRQMVLAAINNVFAQDSFDSAIAQWRAVADQLRAKFQKLSELMDGAEADVLAYMGFPKAHRTQIHTTNPLERLNAEIKRRSGVVGIFPNSASVTSLVGALLLEQKELDPLFETTG